MHDAHSLHKCSMSMQSPTNLTASKYSHMRDRILFPNRAMDVPSNLWSRQSTGHGSSSRMGLGAVGLSTPNAVNVADLKASHKELCNLRFCKYSEYTIQFTSLSRGRNRGITTLNCNGKCWHEKDKKVAHRLHTVQGSACK